MLRIRLQYKSTPPRRKSRYVSSIGQMGPFCLMFRQWHPTHSSQQGIFSEMGQMDVCLHAPIAGGHGFLVFHLPAASGLLLDQLFQTLFQYPRWVDFQRACLAHQRAVNASVEWFFCGYVNGVHDDSSPDAQTVCARRGRTARPRQASLPPSPRHQPIRRPNHHRATFGGLPGRPVFPSVPGLSPDPGSLSCHPGGQTGSPERCAAIPF